MTAHPNGPTTLTHIYIHACIHIYTSIHMYICIHTYIYT